MLTRLKVNGFKNLVDVDVRFGPFTCIAGVNGSGKSNLLDAIRFLSLLAEKPLIEAARAVRGSGNRAMDIRSLFHRVGDRYADEMSFEAEMIVPAEGVDDRGLTFEARSRLLRYGLTLRFVGEGGIWPNNQLQIMRETLVPVPARGPGSVLGFPYSGEWRDSVASRSDEPSDGSIAYWNGQDVVWHLSQKAPGPGEPGQLNTRMLTRTQVSSRHDARSEMAMLAQQEMCAWRVFNLDPAKIGEPDSQIDAPEIGGDGSHVAATLYHLAHQPPPEGWDADQFEAAVYARVGNRVATLVDDVRDVSVDYDERRESLMLQATDRSGVIHAARALSDGTLRFLALAVLEQQEAPGVYCFEEPENGIHPGRIPALLELLQAIAMDTNYPIEPGNPLRQVIISTHSPSIVSRVPGNSLVIAELRSAHRGDKRFKRAHFTGLAGTWRVSNGQRGVELSELLKYLNPDGYRPLPERRDQDKPEAERRILDREDVRDFLTPMTVDG